MATKIISEFHSVSAVGSNAKNLIAQKGLEGWSFCGTINIKEWHEYVEYYVFQKEAPSPEEVLGELLKSDYSSDMDNFHDTNKYKPLQKGGYEFISIQIWNKDKFDASGYTRIKIEKEIANLGSYIIFYKEV